MNYIENFCKTIEELKKDIDNHNGIDISSKEEFEKCIIFKKYTELNFTFREGFLIM